VTPTRRSAVALGAAALSFLFVDGRLGLLLMAGVLSAVLVDALAVRSRPNLEVDLPALVPRGIRVEFRVASQPGVAARHDLRLPTPPDLVATPAEGVDRLAGSLVAHRRGAHRLEGVAVRRVGPLGLGGWLHAPQSGTNIVVFPDVVTARRLARAVATGRFQQQGQRRRGRRGLGTEFETIRDYAPDDDIRQVNWRATQRLGRPMSNQYRIDQDRDVICLIDVGRLMGAPVGRLTRLDVAVDAATAIAYTADVLGDRAGVVAFDRKILRNLASRRRGGEAVVQAIYDLEPTEEESDYEAAFRSVARHKRALVVVFTDLLEEGASRPLVEAVPLLERTHQVIVAVCVDEDLVQAVGREPRVTDDVYRAAIALEALAAKDRIVHRLRHVGASVVEAPASGLAGACVAAYLEVKALSRI